MPDKKPISLPDAPAARRLAEWLEAFNTGDPETLRRSIEVTHAPELLASKTAKARADSRTRTYAQSFGMSLYRVSASSPFAAEALLCGNLAEDWWTLRVDVQPDPPYLVTSLNLSRASAPIDASDAESLSPEAIVGRLESYVNKLAAADAFSGAVLLALHGTPLLARAWGLASRAWGRPNTVATRFNLGSCNKMFTAIATLQQVEAGRLGLDDRVGAILPDYPNADVAENVTVHHLLTHTSGMGSFFNQRFAGASRARFRKVSDYAPLYVDDALEFRPGARFGYSNSGMMLLGVILEKVSGEDYFQYIRQHVYGPAGMVNTESFDLDADEANVAVGYTNTGEDGAYRPGLRRSNIFTHVAKGSPAGGGFSTVEDLLRFDQALRNGTLLNPETRDMMLTPQAATDFDPAVQIGYGIFLEEVAGKRIAGHSGVFAGVNTQLDMHLDTGFTVVVLSNYDPPAAKRVAHKVREWVAANDE